MERSFWFGKKVFITGHTGFKGTWLSIWLNKMGAEVSGYSLIPDAEPSLFVETKIGEKISHSYFEDIRDLTILKKALKESAAEIVFHLAAQPLVCESYSKPVETFETNIMGTVNILEAVRQSPSVRAVVNITTDKVYENKEWIWGYRENDSLGGYDPYSNSKACSEFVTSSYRESFFNTSDYQKHGVAIATARSGNVIGGGDWAKNRLIPDCIKAFIDDNKVTLRNPESTRPWQHVLDPLSGYLSLGQKLYEKGVAFSGSWNFAPAITEVRSVEWIVSKMCRNWGGSANYSTEKDIEYHESSFLSLDNSKSGKYLQWKPRWGIEDSLNAATDWYRRYYDGESACEICYSQILEYGS